VLKRVGVAVAPNDAVNEVLQIVDYVSPFDGGKGVVRDVIEKVLKLQGKWVGTVL
jgi:3-deoxy-D-manno-octulosonate 8-phosphate phosphatase (KDO 8-P phosphatase)